MPKSSIAPQVSVSLLFLGSACFIVFGLIGSHVDSDGVLREPFALLPIGWALIAAGALIGVYGLTRAGWRAWSRRRR
ncbi:MAG: DUF3955 domain-containing protein [Lysobacter sp.]|nr:DUF3955 domain-containing protein [Lysobacter sp.]